MGSEAKTETARVLVEARGLVKRFPGVVALKGVDCELRKSQIHCLIGENGAGKSTLIKILAGYHAPDAGAVTIDGHELPHSPAQASRLGIAAIHQEHQLVADLSVAENVMLGAWPARYGFVTRRAMRMKAQRALERVGPHLAPGADRFAARLLSPGEGQLTEIARALAREARLLILDEPTTALSVDDVERLFAILGDLRRGGLAMLYVSHRLEEILELADHITVLRDGFVVSTGPRAEYDEGRLVRDMVGEDVDLYGEREKGQDLRREEVALRVRGLRRQGVLHDIDLDLRAGEIVGIAGLEGAGRTEVVRAIFGADRIDQGDIWVFGKKRAMRGPRDAMENGMGLIPEDRQKQGVFPAITVEANLTVTLLSRLARLGLVRQGQARETAAEYVERLRIRTPSLDALAGGLSGGNQQKVVIGKWLARAPRILILDEPTKGIDVGAKSEIHRLMREWAANGVAILLISGELGEVLAMCDRVLVMREGRIVGELEGEVATKEAVMGLATGVTGAGGGEAR